MENRNNLYSAYRFMRLREDVSLEEIRRQYKDLMILWHPDKHYNNKEKYSQYEDLTCRLTGAYSTIITYLNDPEKPAFDCDTTPDQVFAGLHDVPDDPDLTEIDKMEYCPELGVPDMLNTVAANAFLGTINIGVKALKGIDNFFGLTDHYNKSRLATIDGIVETVKCCKIYKHTIVLNSISYARKVNFIEHPLIAGGYFGNKIAKKEYTYSVMRYLDYLNDNMFCGTNGWRLIESSEIRTLLFIARSQGYEINEKAYTDDVCFLDKKLVNGGSMDLSYIKHVPLNGRSFREFLGAMGFYNIDEQYYWYGYDKPWGVFDLENCVFRSINNSNKDYYSPGMKDKPAALWPVNSNSGQKSDMLLLPNS